MTATSTSPTPHTMTSAVEAWLQEQTSQSSEELANGDGCHPDEINALRHFLNGNTTVREAAVAITRPITLEKDPPGELYRLWGLLADALVEHGQEVGHKSLDLLAAIQELPTDPPINWSDLTGFGHMWFDCHSLHLHGPDPWESELKTGGLADDKKALLYGVYEDLGRVEASIWLRIPKDVNSDLGYDVLNLACCGRAGVEMFLYQIRGWLAVAGLELRLRKKLDERMSFPRWVADRPGGATMEENWARWEKALVLLSGDEGSLPKGSREVAKECSEMLQKAREQDHRTMQV